MNLLMVGLVILFEVHDSALDFREQRGNYMNKELSNMKDVIQVVKNVVR